MAPEVLQTGSLSMSADVYSFAMIMLELWTGKSIYKDFPQHQVRSLSQAQCPPCQQLLHLVHAPGLSSNRACLLILAECKLPVNLSVLPCRLRRLLSEQKRWFAHGAAICCVERTIMFAASEAPTTREFLALSITSALSLRGNCQEVLLSEASCALMRNTLCRFCSRYSRG